MREIRTLRDWRYRNGMGLRELARKAGVAPRVISNIEHGRSHGSPQTWVRIAAALNLDPAQILEYRQAVGLEGNMKEKADES